MNVERIKDIRPILEKCFSSDDDLVNEYHIVAGEGLSACVDRTHKDLERCHRSFKFFSLTLEEKFFGYFGSECIDNINFLTGFFIMPEFRNKEGHEQFWKVVNSYFGKERFFVGIHAKNTRASSFLLKSGGHKHMEINTDKVNGFVYRFN